MVKVDNTYIELGRHSKMDTKKERYIVRLDRTEEEDLTILVLTDTTRKDSVFEIVVDKSMVKQFNHSYPIITKVVELWSSGLTEIHISVSLYEPKVDRGNMSGLSSLTLNYVVVDTIRGFVN